MPFRQITRRSVLKSGGAAAVSLAARGRGFGLAPEGGAVAWRQLEYGQVVLGEGPLREQFTQTQARFLGIDDDMLLKPFRQGAGLAAPGEDMGGWYSRSRFFNTHYGSDGFVPGHSFGQYLSALARGAAMTGDRATKVKVEALVAGIQPALVSRFYDGYHLPAYTFDKLCCGLSDAYALAGVQSAKPALAAALAAALPHLPEKALSRPEQRARPHQVDADTWDETYTLPENLFLAYQRTGDPAYREAAARFLEDDLLFNPLAEEINVLPGEHAYSHVNALSSAMQAYLTTGSAKHLRAASNGFRMVQDQSYATGGWGPGESLLRPKTDDLGRSIFSERNSFETPCGAYAHFKITRYLLRVTRDARYGDSMERVLYNTVLGSKPILEDGSSFYYSDYSTSGRKTYHHDKWPCCSGTLPQIAADYGISAYLGSPEGMVVNLYVPSRVSWQQGGAPVTLVQETQYPNTPTTRLTVKSAGGARRWTMSLRIPAWVGPGTRVLVNGKSVAEVVPGTFHSVSRDWRDGDTVEVEFGMPLRLETLEIRETPVTQAPAGAALAAAPLVPAAQAGTGAAGVGGLEPAHPAVSAPTPVVSTAATTVLAALMRGPVVYMATGPWPIEMSAAQLIGATPNTAGDVLAVATETKPLAFKPFPATGDELYRTYQPIKQA